MYRKILVPLDGSALARKAIAHAGRLASQLEAKCHLLWVQPLIGGFPSGVTFAPAFPFQPPYVMPGAPDDQESVAREIEELIEAALAQAAPLTYARNWSCDLIVMPNPQYVGLAKLLAGREAQHVTEQAECPVLLVVDDGTPDSLHRETLHREICQKIAPHHKLLAQAARCDEDAADRAFPEAVAMLLKGLATRRPSGSRLADIVNELRSRVSHHARARDRVRRPTRGRRTRANSDPGPRLARLPLPHRADGAGQPVERDVGSANPALRRDQQGRNSVREKGIRGCRQGPSLN